MGMDRLWHRWSRNVVPHLTSSVLRPTLASCLTSLALAMALLLAVRLTSRSDVSCTDDLESVPNLLMSCCRLPQVFDEGESPTMSAVVYSDGGGAKSEGAESAGRSWNSSSSPLSSSASLLPSTQEVYERLDRENVREIIVCADETNVSRAEAWAKVFTSLRHFTIRTNSVGMASCFNRAMRSSSSELFLLLEEHNVNVLPVDNEWLRSAIDLFSKFETLGVLGGGYGYIWEDFNAYEFGDTESHASARSREPFTRTIPFVAKRGEGDSPSFMFVECASGAPLLVRAKAMSYMQGFRLDVPRPMADCALALDAWSTGWQVGLFAASVADTRAYGLDEVTRGVKELTKRHRYDRAAILHRVRELNYNNLTALEQDL